MAPALGRDGTRIQFGGNRDIVHRRKRRHLRTSAAGGNLQMSTWASG